MRKPLTFAIAIGLALSFSVALAVAAHSGTGEAKIQAEPASLTAGGTIVLAGSGLEPNNERILVLAGEGLTVEFGTVTTDAEGMFSKELIIPSHLPSGNYELRAIGDETLTTTLAITAAAGGAQDSTAANETVVARERNPQELGAIIVLVVLTVAAGMFLVLRAERFKGEASA